MAITGTGHQSCPVWGSCVRGIDSSPSSSSGGGSSPGSDRGVWCENCNARLVELKRQALKLLLPGPLPGKVSYCGVLCGKMRPTLGCCLEAPGCKAPS